MTKRIVVCDDVEGRRGDWQRKLETFAPPPEWEIELLTADELDHELKVLQARQLAARPDSGTHGVGIDPDVSSKFDQTSILIVDYDLALFEKPGLTGERVTYLARCYSTCKVIVGVNITGQTNYFDLTLVDHINSFADVNVGSDQLTSPVLWGGKPQGLSPWSWPSLPSLLTRHDRCVEIVRQTDGKLLKTVGLADISLPRQISQPIESDGEEDPDFDTFVRKSQLGLRGEDAPWSGTIARVGATRAMKWLQCIVLTAQDILVDAPHLAQRNPLLLGVDPEHLDHDDFEKTTDRETAAAHMVDGLKAHRMTPSPWFDRPLWRSPDVNGDDSLPGVASPWDRPDPSFFFCEDVSRFLPPPLTRRFLMDDTVPTSQPVRYVAKPGAPGLGEIIGDSLDEIQYLPKVRLTL
jgi:hypothetical protein